MAPPTASENQDKAPKAVDTEKMYREMAEEQDPRRLIEMRQEAEKKQAEAKHARGRAATEAEKSTARAEVLTAEPAKPAAAPTAAPQAAPAAAPAAAPTTAPQAAPTAPTAAPAAAPTAPAENAPATPSTAPAGTAEQPAAPADASAATAGATPPAAPAEGQGFGEKFGDFFKKLWDGLSKLIESITAKLSGWFSGKKAAEGTAGTPQQSQPAENSTPDKESQPTPTAESQSAGPAEDKTASNRELTLREAERLQIEPAFALAIMTVESGKKGLNEDGTPVIRFEPHIFNNYVEGGHGTWGASKLVGRKVDGVSCEGGQAAEHACLQKAISINRDAAYKAISMGQGQIMGFNAGIAGYTNAEAMFRDFSATGGGETAQIKVIEKSPAILRAARNKDYAAFTSTYNGAKPGNPHHARYVAALERAYRNNGGGEAAPGRKKPDEAVV
jgi:hypothetical protein